MKKLVGDQFFRKKHKAAWAEFASRVGGEFRKGIILKTPSVEFELSDTEGLIALRDCFASVLSGVRKARREIA